MQTERTDPGYAVFLAKNPDEYVPGKNFYRHLEYPAGAIPAVITPQLGNTGMAGEYFFGRLGISTLTKLKREHGGDETAILPSLVTDSIKERGILDSPAMICFPFKIGLGYMMQALEELAEVKSRTGINAYPLIMTHKSSGYCRERCYSNLDELILRDSPNNPYKEFDFYSVHESKSGVWDTVVLLSGLSGQHPLSVINALNETIERLKMIGSFEDEIRYAQSRGGDYYADDRTLTEAKHQATKADLDNSQLQKILNKYLAEEVHCAEREAAREREAPLVTVALTGEILHCEELTNNSSHYLGQELLRRGCYFVREVGIHHYLDRLKLSLDQLALWIVGQMNPLKRDKVREDAKAGGLRHDAGGHSVDYVALEYRQRKKQEYDGIFGIGPFGCAPNIEALQVIRTTTGIPHLYIQIDEQMGAAGYITRIEAWLDLIMRKKMQRMRASL